MDSAVASGLAGFWIIWAIVAILWAIMPFVVFQISGNLQRSNRIQQEILDRLDRITRALEKVAITKE